jgi:hypothetical protein
MKSTSFVMNFVMLAIFVTFVAIASQYPPQARFMPFVVGIPSIGLCLLQIFLDIRAARRKTVEVEDSRSDVEKARDEASHYAGRPIESAATAAPGIPEVMDASSIPPGMVGREILMWTYFLGFIGSVLLFGFWFTIPLFLITFLHFEAKLTWLKAVLTGVIATTIFYLAIAKGLRVDLHPGFITEYLFDL